MPDFPKLPIITPPGPGKPSFPDLQIVNPDPPRMSLREKYGNLYYLAIAGLVISILLVTNFAVGLWITRDLWVANYVLNDDFRPEPERLQAAWAFTRHPAANDVQRMEIAFRKTLPDLVRYIVAEGLTTEAIRSDPKGYAVMVAKSHDWPDWLRLVLVRPMAYGVGEGYRIAWEPLDLLRENKDPAIALWATYTRAAMAPGDAPASAALDAAARREGMYRPLAALLDAAAKASGEPRRRKLDEATAWLRNNHPPVFKFWGDWEEWNGKLTRRQSAP